MVIKAEIKATAKVQVECKGLSNHNHVPGKIQTLIKQRVLHFMSQGNIREVSITSQPAEEGF